ncbi:organic hydroperoxide resistance protein [Trinickia dinghuensis]|nr:organic hydroperoxide resistance protein [Trinickia dinghuensis]
MSIVYTGKTYTTGGRSGLSHSDDHRLDIKLSPPGSSGEGTNPEQLFAAGWSACFIGAMGRAAQEIGVKVPADTSVAAEVDLCSDPDKGFFLQARLNVTLPGLAHDVAQSLVERAHQICPYSKATRGNIEVALSVL